MVGYQKLFSLVFANFNDREAKVGPTQVKRASKTTPKNYSIAKSLENYTQKFSHLGPILGFSRLSITAIFDDRVSASLPPS